MLVASQVHKSTSGAFIIALVLAIVLLIVLRNSKSETEGANPNPSMDSYRLRLHDDASATSNPCNCLANYCSSVYNQSNQFWYLVISPVSGNICYFPTSGGGCSGSQGVCVLANSTSTRIAIPPHASLPLLWKQDSNCNCSGNITIMDYTGCCLTWAYTYSVSSSVEPIGSPPVPKTVCTSEGPKFIVPSNTTVPSTVSISGATIILNGDSWNTSSCSTCPYNSHSLWS